MILLFSDLMVLVGIGRAQKEFALPAPPRLSNRKEDNEIDGIKYKQCHHSTSGKLTTLLSIFSSQLKQQQQH